MQKLLTGLFLLVGIFSTALFAEETIWQKDINTALKIVKKEQKTVMNLEVEKVLSLNGLRSLTDSV